MSEFYGNPNSPNTNDSKVVLVELMEERKKFLEDKYKLLNEIKTIENKINQLDKMIYSICKHEWAIDRSSYGEHTEYYCKKCNSYKD